MSIFGREDQPQSSTTPQPPTARPTPEQKPASRVTLISNGTKIEGEISGPTEVRIEGTVDGKVNVAAQVSIGSGGQVRGEVHAKSVAVAGRVIGNILGDDNVDIHASGKLEGDVKAPRVAIADGAYFKGRVEMTGKAAPEKAPAPSPPQPKPTPTAAAKPAPRPTPDGIKTPGAIKTSESGK